MANICAYKVIVKGRKNACYAFVGSMSALDEKCIVEESGTDEAYTLRFEGSCKWSVDSYCNPWEGDVPVALPDDAEEAMALAEDQYWYKTVQDRSRMFGVEVLCNSADLDQPVGEFFEHYISGELAGGQCPEELAILDDPEEGCRRCTACGDEQPEENCVTIDGGSTWFCKWCYNEIFGGEDGENWDDEDEEE